MLMGRFIGANLEESLFYNIYSHKLQFDQIISSNEYEGGYDDDPDH